jgi:uncharacterized RDD family membrane protein YckC
MDSKDYSNYSLQELYALYTKMNEGNPSEAKIIYEQILIKEKSKDEMNTLNNLASLSDRLAAALVDMAIIGIPIFVILFCFFGFDGMLSMAKIYGLAYTVSIIIVGQLLFLSVNGRFLYKNGQTIGKKILEIKIVDIENNLPKLYRSYGLRYFIPALFPLIPFLGGLLGLADILFIFRKDRRCIHDHIAGTKVISVA